MPAITVKNIPDELYDHLKIAAQVHHRSINSELIHCLESTLLPRKAAADQVVVAARALRAKVSSTKITERAIDAAKNQGRK